MKRCSSLALSVDWLKRKGGSWTTPEEARLDQRPEDSVSTELCENISRVNLSDNAEEPPQDIQGNSFTDAVTGQRIVVFVQGRMWDIAGAGDDTCIVTKRASFSLDWSTEAAESTAHVHNRAATNSEPRVAVSTLPRDLQSQLAGVESTK
jgi:hypothetical protein